MTNGVGRGIVQRKRVMSDEAAREFLKIGQVAHVGTVCEDGWPYVLPLAYVYEGGPNLYFHTGNIRLSLVRENLKMKPQVCLEVSEKGDLHPGKQYACQSALVYTSVVAYGTVTEIEDESKKSWFFDRLLEKHGEPEWTFDPGYPLIDKIALYEMKLEIVTGKDSQGLRH